MFLLWPAHTVTVMILAVVTPLASSSAVTLVTAGFLTVPGALALVVTVDVVVRAVSRLPAAAVHLLAAIAGARAVTLGTFVTVGMLCSATAAGSFGPACLASPVATFIVGFRPGVPIFVVVGVSNVAETGWVLPASAMLVSSSAS